MSRCVWGGLSTLLLASEWRLKGRDTSVLSHAFYKNLQEPDVESIAYGTHDTSNPHLNEIKC